MHTAVFLSIDLPTYLARLPIVSYNRILFFCLPTRLSLFLFPTGSVLQFFVCSSFTVSRFIDFPFNKLLRYSHPPPTLWLHCATFPTSLPPRRNPPFIPSVRPSPSLGTPPTSCLTHSLGSSSSGPETSPILFHFLVDSGTLMQC